MMTTEASSTSRPIVTSNHRDRAPTDINKRSRHGEQVRQLHESARVMPVRQLHESTSFASSTTPRVMPVRQFSYMPQQTTTCNSTTSLHCNHPDRNKQTIRYASLCEFDKSQTPATGGRSCTNPICFACEFDNSQASATGGASWTTPIKQHIIASATSTKLCANFDYHQSPSIGKTHCMCQEYN